MKKRLSCLCFFCICFVITVIVKISIFSSTSSIYKAYGAEAGMQKKEEADNPPQNLYAYASCLLDAENNRVLFEKNGTEQLPMASTTKIMTLLVILDNSSMDEIVTVSQNAAAQPDVQLNINTGEQYRLEDLLYSLMLESHNDTAVALAEHVGGSVEGFCAMMNEKAAALGLADTCFETPNGLDSENHYTTAVELAVIASYAMKNETFLKITNTTSYQFNELTTGRSFFVSNKNRFLYMMEGAVGMKTGFTGKAGYCFVGAVKRGDYQLISVVLACGWPPNRNYKWSDTKKLMDYGLASFHKRDFFENVSVIVNGKTGVSFADQLHKTASKQAADHLNSYLTEQIIVEGGEKESVSAVISDLEIGKLLLGNWENTSVELNYETILTAPVEEGQIIGSAVFYIDGKEYASTWIKAGSSVKSVSLGFYMKKVLKAWWNL